MQRRSLRKKQTNCQYKLLLLYACQVIYLINKGVISPYVQE